MKKEDIKKPNPEALQKAAKLINDLVKKKPSDEFFDSVEKTESNKKQISSELPKVASSVSNDLIENHH